MRLSDDNGERERARLTAFLWLLLLLGGRLGFVRVTLELASLWHPGSILLSGSLERERETLRRAMSHSRLLPRKLDPARPLAYSLRNERVESYIRNHSPGAEWLRGISESR